MNYAFYCYAYRRSLRFISYVTLCCWRLRYNFSRIFQNKHSGMRQNMEPWLAEVKRKAFKTGTKYRVQNAQAANWKRATRNDVVFFSQKINAVSKWTAAGQGFKTGSLIFFGIEGTHPIRLTTAKRSKSCIDRRSDAWLMLGWESETLVCDTFYVDCRSRFSKQYDSFDKFRKSNRSYASYYMSNKKYNSTDFKRKG